VGSAGVERIWRDARDLGIDVGAGARSRIEVAGLVGPGRGAVRGRLGGVRYLEAHAAVIHRYGPRLGVIDRRELDIARIAESVAAGAAAQIAGALLSPVNHSVGRDVDELRAKQHAMRRAGVPGQRRIEVRAAVAGPGQRVLEVRARRVAAPCAAAIGGHRDVWAAAGAAEGVVRVVRVL